MAHVPLVPIGSPLDEQLDPATRDAQAAAMAKKDAELAEIYRRQAIIAEH